MEEYFDKNIEIIIQSIKNTYQMIVKTLHIYKKMNTLNTR